MTTTTQSAPAPVSGEISDDILGAAAAKFGVKLPGSPSAAASKPAEEGKAEATAETDDEKRARLPKGDDETDDDYEARLADDEGPVATDQETDEERTARLQQQDGETDEDHAARLTEEGVEEDEIATHRLTAEQKADAARKAREEIELKKLPEAVRKPVQDLINKRLGQMTARTKAKETELGNQITTLQAELAEAKEAAEGKAPQATIIGDVHPLLLADDEGAIIKYVEGVEAFEDWAADHADGYDPTAEEIAKGAKPVAAAEIRQRLRALQRERDKIVPQARAALAQRATHEAEAKKLVPALFDAKSPEYQAARSLLREQPELKRFPDYRLRVAAIVLGNKALADLKAASGKPKPKPVTRASRAPGGGDAPKGGFERKPAGADAPTAVKQAIEKPTLENRRAAALAVLLG